MKFFIVLVILLAEHTSPKLFVFRFEDFSEQNTCANYINGNKDYLKMEIEKQFPVKTIEESMVVCMTQPEIDKITKILEGKQWQEQQHI